MPWDLNDIRYFLAVVRMGSTLAAATQLNVNQTTCARRIATLEVALGAKLFERSMTGYRLTPIGSALLEHAESVERAADAFMRSALELVQIDRSEILFSTSDVLADLIAGPAIAQFSVSHPHIRVTLHVDSRDADIGNGEADIALRAAPTLSQGELIVRKVMDTPWAFYCARDWKLSGSWPTTLEAIGQFPMATLEGRPSAMLRAAFPDADIRYISNSMIALVEVLHSGNCVSALPILIGAQHPGLVRCFTLDLDAGGLWLVFHERHKGAPHIRAFIDHLTNHIARWRSQAVGLPDS